MNHLKNNSEKIPHSAPPGLGDYPALQPGLSPLPGRGGLRALSRRTDHREGIKLLDDLATMGQLVVILTGGEPLLRDDIFDLAAYGHG